ncbi:group-specific protein [Streptomyces sp. LZ34]
MSVMGGRRLKPVRQVRYAPTENGAAVLGPSGALALRGATVYAWLERLWPLLDGAQDVDAVLARLPDGHRAVANRLLETLQRRGFLREATEPRPHGLTATELHRHRHEIAYIGHWLDSPEHRFERYRTARVLLLGDGPLHAAARHALLACGLRQVFTEDARAPYDILRAAAHTADAVVYTGDATTPQAGPDVAAVERGCGGAPLFRALSRPGDCWLLPPTTPLSWADVRHRIRPAATPDSAGPMTAAAAALVGGRLALAVFRLLTGVPDEDAAAPGPVPEILRVDLATLAARRHRVLPAPPGHGPEDAQRRMKELRETPALDPHELTERLADCADDITGPYTPPTTDYGGQIPLTVARCVVAGAGAVVGASLDPRAATAVALRRAGASYALSAAGFVPPRSAGQAAGAAASFRAERLTDGSVRALPAPLVLPCPAGEGQRGGRPAGAGTACAESWDAAVEAALLHAVRSLARRRAADTPPPATLLPEGLLTDPEAVRHWRLLRTLGPVPEVRDLSGGLVAPVIGLVAGDRLVSVGCAATAAGALAEAAQELLLARQRGTEPAAGGPPLLPASTPPAGHLPAPLPGPGPRERVAFLATSLAAEGYTAYAVPLDHDPDFHTLVPFVARVVLDEAR